MYDIFRPAYGSIYYPSNFTGVRLLIFGLLVVIRTFCFSYGHVLVICCKKQSLILRSKYKNVSLHVYTLGRIFYYWISMNEWKSINQWVSQSVNPSISQPVNQSSTYQSKSNHPSSSIHIHPSINQSIDGSIDKSTSPNPSIYLHQSTNKPIIQ